MIAIIVDALLRGPARLEGGRRRARRQPLARDVDGLACAPRGRRSSPAPCSPAPARWARRSCSRWSRGPRASRPNPLDGLTFLFEPLRPLAATIVEDAESLNAPAVQAVGLRVRAAAAVLEPLALDRRLAGQAADEEVRDPRLMAVAPRTRAAAAAARPAAQAPRSTSRCATWRWGDRIAFVLCWAAGPRAVRDRRARSSSTWPSRACSTCNLDLLIVAPAAVGRPDGVGRLPGPDPRHGAADASSGSRSPRRSPSPPRSGSSSTGARRGWRAPSSRASRSSPARPTS